MTISDAGGRPGAAPFDTGGVLDALTRSVVVTDPDGAIRAWNAGAERLYGVPASEALGRSIVDLTVPPGSRDEVEAIVAGVVAGEPWSGEFTVQGPGGPASLASCSILPVLDPTGGVVALVVEAEDITHKRAVEERVVESHLQLQLAIEAGRLGTWRWSIDGSVVWDDATEALFGFEPGSFDGTLESYAAAIHPDDRASVLGAVNLAMRTGQAYDVEHRVATADGTVRWLEGRGRPIRDGAGRITGIAGYAVEITTRKLAELRLASLQAVTAGLSAATTPTEVAGVIVHEASAALGGVSGSLCVILEDGATFELISNVGYQDAIQAAFRRFPVAAPLPAGDVVRSGEILFLGSLAERDERYPDLASMPTDSASFAVVPLIVDDRPLGVFTIGFPDERTFDERDRAFVEALARLSAQALERTRLFAASEQSRLAAEQASDRLAFLAEASTVLGASLDYEETLTALATLAVPRLADLCTVAIVDEHGAIRQVALEHRQPHVAAMLREAASRTPPRIDAEVGIGRAVRTGEPEYAPAFDEALRSRVESTSAETARVLDQLGLGSGATVPLVARGRAIGAISLANSVDRQFTEDDYSLALQLAARAAIAVDNARLFAQNARIAETLQHNLLPPELPEVEGLDLAASYVPAGFGEVGGDFYDALQVGPRRWLLIIGDVCGNGIEAARLTALARHTLRSAALAGASPAVTLAHLNSVLVRGRVDGETEDPRFLTACVVRVDLRTDGARVTIASAGHPLPVLLPHGGEPRFVGDPGTLLGVLPDALPPETVMDLSDGDILVLVTDGVVERHVGADFFGEDGLLQTVGIAGHIRATAAQLTSAIGTAAAAFGPENHDDMAILVARVVAS